MNIQLITEIASTGNVGCPEWKAELWVYIKKLGGLYKHLVVEEINSKFCPCDFLNVIQQVDLKAGMRIYDFFSLTKNPTLFFSRWKVRQNQEDNYFILG